MTSIAIFGATSAMAEHVARLYAGERARIALVGRNGAELARIAADLTVRGAEAAFVHAADLNRIPELEPIVDACEAAIGPLDVTLLAYGVLGDQIGSERDSGAAHSVIQTNFASPACLAGILAMRMEARGRGVIAAITSVAGDRGRRSNYVYGSAKGGLSIFLAGLRHRLSACGVKVVDIRPGFVDTPMTAHLSKGGPLWATPDRVARDIKRAIEGGRSVVYTPWFWSLIMRIVRALPESLFHRTKL